MNIESPEFALLLEKSAHHARDYVLYSPTQIARGDHLKDDPTIGERAWSIPETTGRFLYKLIRTIGATSALELGTSVGYSTLWIMAALDENSDAATMVTLEKNPKKSELAKNTLHHHFPMIEFHSGMIGNYLQTAIVQPYDFIFMDADRGNYQNYWPFLKQCLHEKSIVVIDNALRNQKSVRDFQDYIAHDPELTSYLHELDNGLFMIARSDGFHSDLYSIVSRIS